MDHIQADLTNYLRSMAFLPKDATLDPKDSLTSAGIIDSIGLIQLIDFIDEKYQIQVPVDWVSPENFDTLEGIERVIKKLLQEKP
ncbi:MAG: acyl carrier protein [Methanomicrobiales archaeon]|nr:acyl carrier protein [Methanomicrobiales archaeon]